MRIEGAFANSYDRFVKRESLLPPDLGDLIKSLNPRSILEFGCGTGTVAVGLALEGFDVTGVDFSADMLKIARKKAKLYNAQVRFIKGDISKINLYSKFDCILCLGNILPQFRSSPSLASLFKNALRHLHPNGVFIAQQLNYNRILELKPIAFAIDIDKELIRIKQYRYRKSHIDFVVTLIDSSQTPPSKKVHLSRLKPWKKDKLLKYASSVGFVEVEILGNYKRDKFDLDSKDAILIARK